MNQILIKDKVYSIIYLFIYLFIYFDTLCLWSNKHWR